MEKEFIISLSCHRHDIIDHIWDLLESHLPGRKGSWGGVAQDNSCFINVVLWILRTGATWRDLPSDYGDWKNTHRRFCRWGDKSIWENLLEVFIDEPDLEWLMIDAGHFKVHQHVTGVVGGNQDMGCTKEGSTQKYMLPWMRHPASAMLGRIWQNGADLKCKCCLLLQNESTLCHNPESFATQLKVNPKNL